MRRIPFTRTAAVVALALIAARGPARAQLTFEAQVSPMITGTLLVGDRPDRFEPRLRKRRPKKYDSMLQPRHVIKRKMLKRVA